PRSACGPDRPRPGRHHHSAANPAVGRVACRPNWATVPPGEASAEPSARSATAGKRRSRTGYVARARAARAATAINSAGHGTGRDEDLRDVESVRVEVS